MNFYDGKSKRITREKLSMLQNNSSCVSNLSFRLSRSLGYLSLLAHIYLAACLTVEGNYARFSTHSARPHSNIEKRAEKTELKLESQNFSHDFSLRVQSML